jgi:hypothetical protein
MIAMSFLVSPLAAVAAMLRPVSTTRTSDRLLLAT